MIKRFWPFFRYMIIFGGKHPFLNKRNELDQKLMLEGRLDFTDTSSVAAQGLGLFGLKLRVSALQKGI